MSVCIGFGNIGFQTLLNPKFLKRDFLYFDNILVGKADDIKRTISLFELFLKGRYPNIARALSKNYEDIDFLLKNNLLTEFDHSMLLDIEQVGVYFFNKVNIDEVLKIMSSNPDEKYMTTATAKKVMEIFGKEKVAYNAFMMNRELNSNPFLTDANEKIIELKNIFDKISEFANGGEDPKIRILDPIIAWNCYLNIGAKIGAYTFAKLYEVDCIPILEDIQFLKSKNIQGVSEVVKISLERLPIPSRDSTWEQLVNFKKLPEANSSYSALREVISRISDLEQAGVEELFNQIRDCLIEIENQLKNHKIHYSYSSVKILVSLSREAIDVVRNELVGTDGIGLELMEISTPPGVKGLVPQGKQIAYI